MQTQHIVDDPGHSPGETAAFFASRGDPQHAASILRPLMSFRASLLDAYDLSVLRGYLLPLGMVLVDDGCGDLIADVATSCLYCRTEHAAGDDHGCPGATPADELDSDDTGSQCASCLHAVQGPPAPYCCQARQKLIEALHGDEAMRIKPCLLCSGTGVLSRGVVCDRCSGTGVAGVAS